MDADVISFEASRGDLVVLDAIHDAHFETEAGPGVYDIHSPRIPSEQEIEERIYEILKKMDIEKVWINPDCGLKTRGNAETWPSLENLVAAAKAVAPSSPSNGCLAQHPARRRLLPAVGDWGWWNHRIPYRAPACAPDSPAAGVVSAISR